MKKRLLSILLILALMLPYTTMAMAAEAIDYAALGFGYEHKLKNVTPLRMLDFEMMHNGSLSQIGFDQITQGSPYPQESWDKGTAFAAVGGTTIKFSPKTELTTGKYIMSFDIWQNFASGAFTYMRFNTDTGKTERNTFAIYGGKIGNLANGWGMEGGSAKYTQETWQHVMMFIDFDKGTIDYMINNEYVMTASTIPDLTSLTMHFEGAANQRRRLDNFTLLEFNSDLRSELVELGIKMPDAFSDSAEAGMSSKYYGNIFKTTDEVELNLSLSSNVSEDVVYDAEYVVKNYEGETVWQGEEKDILVKAGERAECTIKPVVEDFDIYTLYVTVKSRTPGFNDILIDREFSVVNTPSPGYRSPFMGHQIHPNTTHTRFNQVERIVDMSGIGFLRTDFGWNGLEPVLGGGYKFPNDMPDYPDFYPNVAKMGIENIAIVTPWHEAYGGWSHREKIAETPEALRDWERFCADLAAHYKGVINNFEFGNEINFARDEVYSAEEYADVCIAGYRGIKKGNPEAIVLTQGLSRTDTDFVKAMIEHADGEKMFDAVALHTYGGQGSVEMCNWTKNLHHFRAMLDSYGMNDTEIWITEANTSAHQSYSTDQQHAGNLVRMFVQTQGFKAVDKLMFYELQTPELEPGNNEHFFGMIHGKDTKNANGAKKTFLAVCNYNALTEGSEAVETKEGDKEWYARYKKPNGKSLVVFYGEKMCRLKTLDLGAKNATLYDISGNATELSSDDGKYVVSLSDQPAYIEYSGDKFDVVDEKISVDTEIAYTSVGTVEFNLTLPEGAEVEASGKENMTVTVAQNANVANVKVEVKEVPEKIWYDGFGWRGAFDYTEHYMDDGSQIFRDYVNVDVKQNGKTISLVKLPVEYAFASADIYMQVKPYDNTNTKYVELECQVRNNTSKPLSGTINLNKTPGMELEPKRVQNIPAGETVNVTFQMPAEFKSGWKIYGGEMTTDEGEVIEFSLGTVPRSKNYSGTHMSVIIGSLEKRKGDAPVLDGVIDEKEWKNYKISDFDKSQVSYGSQNLVVDGVVEGQSFGASADYGGKMDFSGTVYAQWDEKFLYAAAVVNDDVHFQKQDFLRMYYDDHLYITCKDTMNQRHDTRIDIGLSEFYNREFYTEDDRHGKVMCLYTPVRFAMTAYELTAMTETECYVARKGNVTIYEVKIPWTELISETALENKQFWLSFNFRDYDGDRDKSTSVGGRWYMLTNTQN